MSIKSDVMYYFENHPNEKVFLKDLAASLELEEKQTQTATYQLYKVDGFPLEVIARGSCWIYKPADTTRGVMYIIGQTQKGSTILEDDEGTLWIAKRFEE